MQENAKRNNTVLLLGVSIGTENRIAIYCDM